MNLYNFYMFLYIQGEKLCIFENFFIFFVYIFIYKYIRARDERGRQGRHTRQACKRGAGRANEAGNRGRRAGRGDGMC